MRPQYAQRSKSKFTQNSVRMLQHTDEYQRYDQVKDQGSAFQSMAFLGAAVFFVLLYADFMAALVKHVPFIAGLVTMSPEWLHPVLAVVIFFGSAWINTSTWSATYNDTTQVVTVATAHLLASVAVAVIPYRDLHLPPFVTRATPAHPWPALAPFAGTFTAGMLLYVPFFTGFWKNKAIAPRPYLVTAPAIMLTSLGIWLYIGSVVSQPERPLAETYNAVNRGIVQYAQAAFNAMRVDPWRGLHAVAYDAQLFGLPMLKPLYGALQAHTFCLAVSAVLTSYVIPGVLSVVGAILGFLKPSPAARWVITVAAVCGTAWHLHNTNQLTGLPVAVLASVFTALLVRGFPASSS